MTMLNPLHRSVHCVNVRDQQLSEQSTQSTESDDYDPNAFHVFYQIGTLEYYTGNFKANPDKAERVDEN